MRAEVKEKIRKIKNGELPEGYKVDGELMPVEWNSEHGFIKIESGYGFKLAEYANIGIPLIRINNVKYGFMDHSDAVYLPLSYKKLYSKFLLKKGDMLLALNRPITQNKLKLSRLDLNEAILYQRVGKLIFKEGYLADFYYQYLHSPIFVSKLEKLLVGSDQPYIKNTEFSSIKFPVPRVNEQKKIANILSIWDRAIELKEELIKQKEQQKKGIVQNLLFGKIRVNNNVARVQKGYKRGKHFNIPTDWDDVIIGKVAEQVNEINTENKDYKVLSCTKYDGLVDSLKYFKKQVFSDDLSTYKIVKRGYFAYATNHIEEGSIGLQNVCDYGLVSPMYTVFKVKEGIDNNFLYSLLKTENYRMIFKAMMSASVDRRGSLRWKEFSQIKIPIPSLIEQQGISNILSMLDKEMYLLKQEYDLLKQQKKGLMQLLLTGKVRVPC